MVVYVECKPDALLLEKLGFAPKSIQHRAVSGKGEVIKRLKTQQNVRLLIEEDPLSGQPRALKGLPIEELTPYHLRVAHKGRSKVVIVCPNLEDWLLWLAKRAGVDPEQHGLPRNARDLHKVINKRLDNLDEFLTSLMERPKSKEALQKLQALLQEV